MNHFAKMNPGATLAVGLLVVLGGCGGGSSPTSPVSPLPTPTATPSSTPPPVGGGSVEAVCRAIGYGTPKVGCDHVEVATMLPSIEAAIDQVVAAQPGIFDLDTQVGAGGFRVLDEAAYFQAMQTTLAGMGICSQAEEAGTNLTVKNNNELDETYAILNSKGFVRRGWGSYLQSCIPSGFPLSPEDQFSYVRTAFFGYQCDDVTLPVPASGEVTSEEVPALLVASTIHKGSYEECGPAYKAIEAWIQSHGHASVGPPREIYITDPQETQDPADYVTEIQFPIAVPS
jgi:hypothetical protein